MQTWEFHFSFPMIRLDAENADDIITNRQHPPMPTENTRNISKLVHLVELINAAKPTRKCKVLLRKELKGISREPPCTSQAHADDHSHWRST